MLPNLVLKSLLAACFLAVLVFVPAGTIAWPQGWAFVALFSLGSQATGLWLVMNDPALLAERSKSALGAGQAPHDRAVMAALVLAFVAWLIAMPMDARRFHWSHLPGFLQPLGALLIACAFWGWVGVMRANTFAISAIRIQKERGHRVITSGPYAVVRHPMYAYALPLFTGAPLLLGSGWGLAFLPVFAVLLGARIAGEEALLRRDLPGYEAYAARVRFRLVPLIW
jgi:protein-S-isoprenylcysteine O-methyltransferase Ste14